jgi:acetoacetyl-CoA synthetase
VERIKLWEPSQERIENTVVRRYQAWLADTHGVHTDTYEQLHRWSIENVDAFWESIWTYFDAIGDRGDGPVREGDEISETRWFPGAKINFTENMLRQAESTPEAEAIVGLHETAERESLTFAQVRDQVASLSAHLRKVGVGPGDTVCAVLPSLTQTLVALLATANIGAIWSVVNTDFGVDGIADRFAQIEPKVLFTVDAHEFNGQVRDQLPQLPTILEALPTVQSHILIDSRPGAAAPDDLGVPTTRYSEIIAEPAELVFERFDFSHPLWVLYSSGTTGKPKGIVHSHGGMVLEGLKANGLQFSVAPGDRAHFAVSTTWVVWNLMVDTMLLGATVVTYDGAPMFGRPDRHFAIAAEEKATLFATGAAIMTLAERSGAKPNETLDLSALKTIVSTGSPLPAETWRWAYKYIKSDMLIGSDSGGTDIASGILGSNTLDAVYEGELQGPYLGVDARTVDEKGNTIEGEVGELVMAAPIPSMPVMFWNDPDGKKYRAAYFDEFPDLWRQGDWATKVPGGGFVIHGRSDATINRGGIRMGSSDICNAVESVPGIQESMVIGAELPEGGYYMPLFIVPAPGTEVDDEPREAVTEAIRTRVSPRYVPDEIITAPGVPRTRTGKIVEVPIKRVVQGGDPDAVNRTTAVDPAILEWFIDFAVDFAQEQAAI